MSFAVVATVGEKIGGVVELLATVSSKAVDQGVKAETVNAYT
jgi:hypothetical protein